MINMTDLPHNPELSHTDQPGVVCPQCFRPLKNHNFFGPVQDGYGRSLRAYVGHCCGTGFEVLQFQSQGLWIICRYQLSGRPWVEMQDLPDPSPVVLGPGGDFSRDIDDEKLNQLFKKATETLVAAARAFMQIREMITNKEHRTQNKPFQTNSR